MKQFIVFKTDGSQSEIQAWQAKQALKLAGDKAIVAVRADYSKKEDFCFNVDAVKQPVLKGLGVESPEQIASNITQRMSPNYETP